MVWHADELSAEDGRDSDTTIVALEDLPPGNARAAGNAVSLMFMASENSPHNRALSYDELASAFCPRMLNGRENKYLNKAFLGWFAETVTYEFQSRFVVDEIPEGVEMEVQKTFQLNREDEYTENNSDAVGIAINIAGIVLSADHK